MKQWHVIYTRPRAEKQVNQRLVEQGIKTYLPLQKVVRQWADRKKRVEVPLINSYVFVRTEETERLSILQTYGVVRFVFYCGKPAIVRDKEIDAMKEFLEKTQGYRIEIVMDERVEITSGPMEGQVGRIMQINKNTIKLSIEQLGMSLMAEVDKSQVRRVESMVTSH